MDDEQFGAIRRKVVGRLVLQASFVFNMLLFLLCFALLLGQDMLSSTEKAIGLAVFVLTWGTAVLVHGAVAFGLLGRLFDWVAHREVEHQNRVEKPKHRRLELGDDGELIERWDDETQADEKAKPSLSEERRFRALPK
jgi:hypothetical protein